MKRKNFVKFLRSEFKLSKRKRDGRTINSLAKKAGLDHVMFIRLETGETKFLTLTSLSKIAKALNLNGWQLLKKYEEWK